MPARSPLPLAAGTHGLEGLGATLRLKRRALGVKANAVAAAAGISRVTLYRIEKGEPSVTLGAYVCVAEALGLSLVLVDESPRSLGVDLDEPIRVSDYPELKKLAWHLPGRDEVNSKEALELYERGWRHVDQTRMTSRERALVAALTRSFGRGRLLV
jgi:transcriptional regulator with XRE-family HTH domain